LKGKQALKAFSFLKLGADEKQFELTSYEVTPKHTGPYNKIQQWEILLPWVANFGSANESRKSLIREL